MDEKLNLLTNEVVASIEEEFYVADVEFDSVYCNQLFYDIAKLFYSKNILNLYKVEMLKLVKKCLICLNRDEKNDYTLFLNNLDFLLEIDCINEEDLHKIKSNNIFIIKNEQKLLYAM